MSDWRFASIGGYLTWSNSDDPEDEQYLYSELSPTLIVGHQEKGDVFPVDYIKLMGVKAAIRISELQIDMSKKDDDDFIQTVVAPTKPEADEWFKMITLAIEGGSSPGNDPQPSSPSPAAHVAEPVPAPKAVEPKPDIQAPARRPSLTPQPIVEAKRVVDPPPPQRVVVPPPVALETPTHQYVPAPRKVDSPPVRSTQQPQQEKVVVAPPPRQPQPISVAPPAPPTNWDEPHTYQPIQPTQSYKSDTYDPNHEIRTTTTTTYDDTRTGGMDPREKARKWMDDQKEDPNSRKWSNEQYQSGGRGGATVGTAGGAAASSTFTAGGGVSNGMVQQQQQSSSSFDAPQQQGGGGQARNPHTNAANNNNNNNAPQTPIRDATTTGWGSSGAGNLPDWNNTPAKVATTTTTTNSRADPGMFDMQGTHRTPTGGNGGGGTWQSSGYDSQVPLAATAGGGANSRQYTANNNGNAAYSSSVPAGYATTPLHANNMNNSGGGFGGNNYTNNSINHSGTYGAGAPSPGPSAVYDVRKRSGMFVNVPPNPQMNRHVAPNVSAIWKEWTDPDGILYVYHELTQTMHRRVPGGTEFETLVEGLEAIPEDDLKHHPYFDEIGDTFCDMNGNVVRNVQNYGNQRIDGEIVAASPDLYRSDLVTSPRGQYSPSRRSRVSAMMPAPRDPTGHYEGRRVHQLVLSTGTDASESIITHQIQPLGISGLMWDPKTGKTLDTKDSDGTNPRNIGPTTLQKQWEHVRQILIQGRYFKKHALKNNATSFRFCFLTGDNAYVVCVPTSEVMLNVHTDPRTFNSVQDSIQYYGPQSRAIPLNTVTRVSLGSEEEFVVRRKGVNPSSTFCIISRTHAFILECNSPKEAKYFADAWTFFLYHSKPLLPHKNRTPQMKRPITHGTRTGISF